MRISNPLIAINICLIFRVHILNSVLVVTKKNQQQDKGYAEQGVSTSFNQIASNNHLALLHKTM